MSNQKREDDGLTEFHDAAYWEARLELLPENQEQGGKR